MRTSLAVLRTEEKSAVGGFSEPSKMPWLSWSIPAKRCKTGARLHGVVGSTCAKCYARKGNYAWPGVQSALEWRYSTLEDLEAWTANMASAITARAARFQPTSQDPWPAFRWHDSGDIQSVSHLKAICQVASATQDVPLADGSLQDVRFWLPTREYAFVKAYLRRGKVPRNLVIRLSAHMVDGPAPLTMGLPVSTVHRDAESYPEAHLCPACNQGGKCGDCRACWSAKVIHVSYPAH